MEILLCISLLSLATAFPNINREFQEPLPQSEESLLSSNIVPFGCPNNQHWSSCKSHCGRNCTNYEQNIPCPPICLPGCVCDDGYVWGSNEECILISQCEIPNELSENADFCPPKEEYSKCLAHCQRNCSNWSDMSLPCQKVCVPGCICQMGMVRGPHGNCIKPRKCPSREFLSEIHGEIDCPLDEHLEHCTAHCQKNCSNWNEDTPCPNICVEGCVCDRGYVRNSFGRCILSEKCPLLQDSEHERERVTELVCPENEYKSKYQALPYSKNLCVSDESQISICPVNYFNGCVCNQGLFRNSDNKCVELRKLPRVNEIDFMRVIEVDTSSLDEYEDLDCHPGTEDKELLELLSINRNEHLDQSESDYDEGNFSGLLKTLLSSDSSDERRNIDNSDLDALLNDDIF